MPEKPTLLSSLQAGSGTAANRSQKCLEAIRRALEEYDCELQVSIHYPGNGSALPNVTVVPHGAQ